MVPLINDCGQLFVSLLNGLDVDCACDIGAMNGAESLRFRAKLPHAKLIAFEANPENFSRIKESSEITAASIEVHHLAVAECDQDLEFHPPAADYGSINHQRGMGSLFPRTGDVLSLPPVRVRATRLDSFFQEQSLSPQRIALWIDVEGKAFEVLSGTEGILEKVVLIHVEVESAPVINPSQKLEVDVLNLLRDKGFVPIARDTPWHLTQRNYVLIRSNERPLRKFKARMTVVTRLVWRVLKITAKRLLRR